MPWACPACFWEPHINQKSHSLIAEDVVEVAEDVVEVAEDVEGVAEDVEGVAEDVQRVMVEHVENQEGRSYKFYTRSTIITNKI